MHSRFDVANGHAVLAGETVGRGDPVVFLHASICDRRMWRPQMAGIAASCQAIAYDRRGFGDTRGQAEEHSAVADLMAVIEAAAGGKPVILVGCSQGARIALDAALLHPASVRGLVLISPTVAGAPEAAPPPALQALMAPLKAAEAARDIDQVNRLKARLFLDGPLAAEGRVAGSVREQFLDMHGRALRAAPAGASQDNVAAYSRLQEFTAPALVMWGNLDFPHIQERARSVAQMLPQGEAYESVDAAHLPSMDHPAAITERLLAFIRCCPPGAGHAFS